MVVPPCPKPLVVGVGNRDRGDDGVGPAAVDAFEDALADHPVGDGIETRVLAGDLSDLVVLWGADRDVIVIDAAVDHRPPGSVTVLDALANPLPHGRRPVSSHEFGLAAAVELARCLDRLPGSLTLIAVSIDETDLAGPLSGEVAAAIDVVVGRIFDAIGHLDPP